jgi:hypothetical protein
MFLPGLVTYSIGMAAIKKSVLLCLGGMPAKRDPVWSPPVVFTDKISRRLIITFCFRGTDEQT